MCVYSYNLKVVIVLSCMALRYIITLYGPVGLVLNGIALCYICGISHDHKRTTYDICEPTLVGGVALVDCIRG